MKAPIRPSPPASLRTDDGDRRTRRNVGGSRPTGTTRIERSTTKRDRQTAAAHERERARRRARRTTIARRTGVALVIAALLAIGGFAAVRRLGPRPIPQAALAAAEAAGCGQVQTPSPSAPGGQHLASGQTYHYTTEPATSGWHDPSQLPENVHVYTTPVPETRAVHNLEHAYVLVYYRADGADALPSGVVDALTPLVKSQFKTIMAPFPDLPTGTSFDLLAWNKLWSCPPTITADQAKTMTQGFIQVFRGTGNAPEPSSP